MAQLSLDIRQHSLYQCTSYLENGVVSSIIILHSQCFVDSINVRLKNKRDFRNDIVVLIFEFFIENQVPFMMASTLGITLL
jgi:hypothetical protein